MYGRCGSLGDACKVFDNMPERDEVSCNAMIASFAHLGDGKDAVRALRLKELQGLKPEKINFVSILRAFCSPLALPDGKLLHAQIVNHGFELDVVVGTALVNMYAKCGDIEEAERMFAKLSKRDVVSWNAMIAAYAQNGRGIDALETFKQMQSQGLKPNRITFVSILDACSRATSMEDGEAAHAQIVENGYESDVVVGTALINMYGKCGRITEAKTVFYKMPERNVFSWTAMISAYVHHGLAKEALECFQQMNSGGVEPNKVTLVTILSAFSSPEALAGGRMIHRKIIDKGIEDDVVVGNALVNMYDRCAALKDAERVFKEMPERDLVSWNSLIGAYARHGHSKRAFHLFRQMQQEGINPDKVTFLKVIDACDSVIYLEDGTLMHASIIENGLESDIVLANSLIHMYGKCGSLEEARNVFNKMSRRDIVSWNTMIAEYADHGHGIEAIELVGQMHHEGFMCNRITLLSILAACSHAGLVPEGCHYFTSMNGDLDIAPTIEHFGCMIDLLARAGRLDEAEELISTMPFEPDHVMWMAMLGACRTHDDVDRGNRMAEYLFELDPQKDAIYAILGSIYAAAGQWDDVRRMRKSMRSSILKKEPGRSLVAEIVTCRQLSREIYAN
ncbi:hypothetical protein O6H91_18G025800 [Diphasiastrum complanatum]|nr:hypothetical protein O6H91_18G025800 [Diphasiastrum complanatum]